MTPEPERPTEPPRRALGTLAVAAILAAGGAAGPVPTAAQEPATTPGGGASVSEPFGGTFHFDPDAEGSADMEAVVDEGVSLVKSWLKRRFARSRIRETNRPYDFMQLFPGPETVTVSTPGWSLDVPREGQLEWMRDEDDRVRVSIEWTGDAWVQTFEAADGTRINRYRLGPDGERLTLDVTLRSDQLESPLTYSLVYRRR